MLEKMRLNNWEHAKTCSSQVFPTHVCILENTLVSKPYYVYHDDRPCNNEKGRFAARELHLFLNMHDNDATRGFLCIQEMILTFLLNNQFSRKITKSFCIMSRKLKIIYKAIP